MILRMLVVVALSAIALPSIGGCALLEPDSDNSGADPDDMQRSNDDPESDHEQRLYGPDSGDAQRPNDGSDSGDAQRPDDEPDAGDAQGAEDEPDHDEESNSDDESSNHRDTHVIDAEGGRISSGSNEIFIPPGALTTRTEIRFSSNELGAMQLEAELPKDFAAISQVMSLTPHGIEFEKPVTLTISAQPLAMPEEIRVLRLEGPQDEEWEVLQNGIQAFDDHLVAIEIDSFSFYLVALPQGEEPPECEPGATRCGIGPHEGAEFGRNGLEVCDDEGFWSLQESCTCELLTADEDEPQAECVCGGEGQDCCLGEAVRCNDGLQCPGDKIGRGGRCVSSCQSEHACPADTYSYCTSEGTESNGYFLSCEREGEVVQCSEEGVFITHDEQGVEHAIDQRVDWVCWDWDGEICITRERQDSHWGWVMDIGCIQTDDHLCARAGEEYRGTEAYCGAHEACLLCARHVVQQSETTRITTITPLGPRCYAGYSTDKVCTLQEHEWRCPDDTTCSTTRRGGCEQTAGPFYYGEDEPSYQEGRACN